MKVGLPRRRVAGVFQHGGVGKAHVQFAVLRVAVGGGDDGALIQGVDVPPAQLVIDLGRVVARARQVQVRRARIKCGAQNAAQPLAARDDDNAAGAVRLTAPQAGIDAVAALPAAGIACLEAAVVKQGVSRLHGCEPARQQNSGANQRRQHRQQAADRTGLTAVLLAPPAAAQAAKAPIARAQQQRQCAQRKTAGARHSVQARWRRAWAWRRSRRRRRRRRRSRSRSRRICLQLGAQVKAQALAAGRVGLQQAGISHSRRSQRGGDAQALAGLPFGHRQR